jgi:hypothetical protein
MAKTLARADIKGILESFSTAIRLDQRYFDAVPTAELHPMYDDQLWRDWRTDHIAYVADLLASLHTIPSAMFKELTEIAATREPQIVEGIALEVFADAVSGSVPREELGSAKLFFGCIVKQVQDIPLACSITLDAKRAVAQWLSATDPLRIAKDPEVFRRTR